MTLQQEVADAVVATVFGERADLNDRMLAEEAAAAVVVLIQRDEFDRTQAAILRHDELEAQLAAMRDRLEDAEAEIIAMREALALGVNPE